MFASVRNGPGQGVTARAGQISERESGILSRREGKCSKVIVFNS